MQRPHEDAVNDLRDAGVFGVGHEGARRRLAGGRRPRRAVIAWEGRDFGEARMVYAASDEGEVSLAGETQRAGAMPSTCSILTASRSEGVRWPWAIS